LALIMLAGSGRPAAAAQIWMAATEPVWREIHGWPANDYLSLFDSSAPWSQASSRVNVFELSKKFIDVTPESDLRRVLEDLKRRGIAIAMQGTPLLASKACGLGVEGHGPPHDMVASARRIKQLGGELAYVSLDEPLYYGHRFQGDARRVACHLSVSELARQTAGKIAEVREVFPDVKVGDIEPVGITLPDAAQWAEDITQWLRAFREATGVPLAFLRLDCVWLRPNWEEQFDAVVPRIRAAKVPLGIIYDGTPKDGTDVAWTTSAQNHSRLVEGKLRGPPDHVAFQSWMDHPRAMLPENAPGSLTNLVMTYTQRR
jgi:hypothetical protein